eukprot:scaffold268941_cov32-Prasinocladus_malaysianus.AAC.1
MEHARKHNNKLKPSLPSLNKWKSSNEIVDLMAAACLSASDQGEKPLRATNPTLVVSCHQFEWIDEFIAQFFGLMAD